jgi:predicted transcriptional regulator
METKPQPTFSRVGWIGIKDDSLNDRLCVYAEKVEKSKSAIIRRAIRDFLDAQGA